MAEIWKPISKDLYYMSSYIGDYEISNKGRIRNAKTGKFIHPFKTYDKKRLMWTNHKRINGNDSTLQFLVDHTVYFGELTFYHDSGLVPFIPEEYDSIFGSYIEIDSDR